ncbi:hypothetical protein LJC60_00985 [Ruminococcaceae bacterium OttesenSCG-928-D13]|nr:hypothetical protein [Ruminococcaceae bacterium OttesenSCG-928-D13]
MMVETDLMLPALDNLTFEEERHLYWVDGRPIHSVSHYLKPISGQVYQSIDKDVLDAAAHRGTAVHFAIELYNAFGVVEVSDECRPYLDAYLAWHSKNHPENIFEERRVYHPTYWYAGTSDQISTIGDSLWIVDYKAVAQLHPFLVGPQLAAYAKAWQAHGVQIEHVASLHLQKNGNYSFKEYPIQENFNVFLECLSVQSHIDENMGGR